MKNYGNVPEFFIKTISRYASQLQYVTNVTDECPNFPSLIYVEPVNKCNLRCIHCIQSKMTRPKATMSFEMFRKIVDEVKAYGTAITLDQQGEPLIHPEIDQFVGYAKQEGVFVSLLTNATLLKEPLADKLLEHGLDRVVFSFDAFSKELYEKIRKGANYEKTLKNIMYFLKRNVETGGKTYTCVSMVLEPANEGLEDAYKDFWMKYPVDEVFLSKLINFQGNSDLSDGIELKFKSLPKERQPICRIPWDHFAINSDGSVSPCTLDYNSIYTVGNINENKLIDLWNNERFKAMRKCQLTKDFSAVEENATLCSGCNILDYPEYDIRDYKSFMETFFVREISQLSRKLCHEDKNLPQKLENARNTLDELSKTPGAL